MFEAKWSDAEKVIARQAFDPAPCNELQAAIQKAKSALFRSKSPSNLCIPCWLAPIQKCDAREFPPPSDLCTRLREGNRTTVCAGYCGG